MICHPKLQNAALSIVLAAGAALAMASGAEAARITYSYTGNPIQCDDGITGCVYEGHQFTGGIEFDTEIFGSPRYAFLNMTSTLYSGSPLVRAVAQVYPDDYPDGGGLPEIRPIWSDTPDDMRHYGLFLSGMFAQFMYNHVGEASVLLTLGPDMQIERSSAWGLLGGSNDYVHGLRFGEITEGGSSRGPGVWTRTIEDTSTIPLPPAALLLFTGVAALFSFRGRKAQA